MANKRITNGIIERYLTICIAFIIFGFLQLYRESFRFITSSDFLSEVITIGASLFAFLLTILTIIIQSESGSVKKMKEHPKFRKFILFNRRIVFLFLTTTLFSVMLSFAKHIFDYLNPNLLFVLASINASVFAFATLDAICFTYLFYLLMLLDYNKSGNR